MTMMPDLIDLQTRRREATSDLAVRSRAMIGARLDQGRRARAGDTRAILVALASGPWRGGSAECAELAQHAHVSAELVARCLSDLVRAGLVQPIEVAATARRRGISLYFRAAIDADARLRSVPVGDFWRVLVPELS